MTMPHVIAQAVLDIEFDSEDQAFAQQPVLSTFMKSRLMSTMDDVLAGFSFTDTVLKIDCLVVDLGTITNADLLDEMTERFRERFRSALREQLQVLKAGVSSGGSCISQDHSAWEQVEYFLRTGHMSWHASPGRDRAVEELFLSVIRSSSEPLAHFLKRSVRRGTIIKRLVSQFREAILAELLRALAPSHASVLLSCMKDIRSMIRQHHLVYGAEEELDKLMWERLLDEIVNSHGAEGVPHDWVGGIVTQLARRSGGDAAPDHGIGDRVVSENERPDFNPELQSQAAIHAYDLHERLRMRLLQGDESATGIDPMDDPAILLDALRQVAPWQLLRLVRELQAGAVPWLPIAARLSTAELRRFLKNILICLHPTNEAGLVDLLRTIDLSAGQVDQEQRFYCQVIESLLRNPALHLEGILSKIRPMGKADHISEQVQEQPHAEDTSSDGVRALGAFESADRHAEELIAALQVPDGLSSEASARLIQRLEAAFAEKSDRLRQVLDSIVRTRPLAARLIALFPDRLLTRVLWLLKPSVHGQAQPVIDLLGIAAAYAEPGLGHTRLRRMAWQFLFTYLIEEGRSFDLGPFIRGFVRSLAEETHQPDVAATWALLRRHLENRQLPALRTLSEELRLELLSMPESLQPIPVIPPAGLNPEAWLSAALQAPDSSSAESMTRLVHTLDRLPVSSSDRLRPLIESLFADRETAARLIARLPERVLTRLLRLLRPSAHAQAQRVADLLATVGTGTEWTLDPASVRRTTWQLLFRYLIEEGRSFDVETFVHRFVASLADLISQPDIASVRARLHRQLTQQPLLAASIDRRMIEALSRTPNQDTRSSATAMSDNDLVDDDESNCAEDIYIANAGQILAAPFVPRLFAMLNLTEGAAFTDRRAAERGVHLLQFMVNERTDSSEYQLVLNKILCGVRTGAPIERAIALSAGEREAIESMLRGMMQHWTVIGNTSVAGFRESFLQREGRLRLQENAWHLLVEARPFDMLLDHIPWSFSTIKYPWMERVLYVEWR